MCQAPETSINIIGENAKVYTLRLLYHDFLTFYTEKQCYGGEV